MWWGSLFYFDPSSSYVKFYLKCDATYGANSHLHCALAPKAWYLKGVKLVRTTNLCWIFEIIKLISKISPNHYAAKRAFCCFPVTFCCYRRSPCNQPINGVDMQQPKFGYREATLPGQILHISWAMPMRTIKNKLDETATKNTYAETYQNKWSNGSKFQMVNRPIW